MTAISTYEIVTVEGDGDKYVVLLWPSEDSHFALSYSIEIGRFNKRADADDFRRNIAAVLGSYRGKL